MADLARLPRYFFRPVFLPNFALYPEGAFNPLPTDPTRARWQEDAESNLKNNDHVSTRSRSARSLQTRM